MPTCGDNGTDGPLPKRCPGTVTVCRQLEVGESLGSGVPDVEPADVQLFSRQFKRDSGLG